MSEGNVRYLMRVWFETSDRVLKRNRYGKRPWDHVSLETRDGEKLTDFGAPVWKAPDGRPVYVWAIDYVVCGDTRWVIFGSFETPKAARRAFGSIRIKAAGRGIELAGYHVFPEHCFAAGQKYDRRMYTDG